MTYIYLLIALILLILLYLLAIMPARKRPNLEPFLSRYYAHRGLHQVTNISPENSMAAFALAVSNNYGIELDVQLTKDKIPVVFHDFNIKRMCNADCKVMDLTYEELNQYALLDSKEKIPTLQSVLQLVNGSVPLIIEYKIELGDSSVCDYSNQLLLDYNGSYCVESFNPLALLWYKKHRPDIMRGQLASNFLKDKEGGSRFVYFIIQNLLLNFITKPHFIAYNYKHPHMLSLQLCRKLYRSITFAWTVQSNEALKESKKHFDFIIFDRFIPDSSI